jgi:hypothetical protein
MRKRDLLEQLTIGRRVAEEESDELASYFVETNQWRKMLAGDVDIVFGPKGSGKSAIYATLLDRSHQLLDKRIVLVSAENPRGAPAFRDLVANPPASEAEFVSIWKLFTLSLVGQALVEHEVKGEAARQVRSTLHDAGLLPGRRVMLRTIVRAAREYARRLMHAEALETTLNVDTLTGLPTGLSARITLAEPSSRQRLAGFVTADELLELANQALLDAGLTVWILFDRLDIAFAESRKLEARGLRALFKVYLDMMALRAIRLKLFLRSDIWRAITATGFREASHITRQMTLAWGEPALLTSWSGGCYGTGPSRPRTASPKATCWRASTGSGSSSTGWCRTRSTPKPTAGRSSGWSTRSATAPGRQPRASSSTCSRWRGTPSSSGSSGASPSRRASSCSRRRH